MKRWFKWLGWSVAGLVVVLLLAVSVIYVYAEGILRHEYQSEAPPLAVSVADGDIEEGRRIAITRGCFGGCHGERMEGVTFVDIPWVVRMVAPDITRAAAAYSDAELVRLLRTGVRKNGRSVLAMPSAEYRHLTDEDIASLIAFIRSEPIGDGPAYQLTVRLLGRFALATGDVQPQAEVIANGVPRFELTDRSDPLQIGRYLALSMCSGCHGEQFTGDGFEGAPNLTVIKAYSSEGFERLLRRGVAQDGREDLGIMTEVATKHLYALTNEEISALYSYFQQHQPPSPTDDGA